MSVMFNQICINGEMLQKYTYIYFFFFSFSNSVSDIGITTHSVNGADSDEFDRMIDCFSNQIDLMENSVEVDSFMS